MGANVPSVEDRKVSVLARKGSVAVATRGSFQSILVALFIQVVVGVSGEVGTMV